MNIKRMALVLAPLALLATGCTGLSQDDRALLDSSAKNSQEAKADARKATEMAQQAMNTAQQAEATAKAAQEQATKAGEQNSRMYQRSLRK